ncbi:MAG: hypothetical protein IJT08_00705, partial [Alphaproteobacteria bacterium]|nr:hypothetical protein [Alphaproteobacteria bacterium]
VKNSNKDIDEDLIKDTANNIATQGKYKDYAEALKEAAKDIQQYFDELKLYGYLERVRSFKWDEEKLGAYRDDDEAINKRIWLIEKTGNLFTGKKIDYGWKRKEGEYSFAEIGRDSDALYKKYILNSSTHEIQQQSHCMRKDTNVEQMLLSVHYASIMGDDYHRELMVGGIHFTFRDFQILEVLDANFKDESKDARRLLTKAQEMELNGDEKTFLNIWDLSGYYRAFINGNEHRIYCLTKEFVKALGDKVTSFNKHLIQIGINKRVTSFSDPTFVKEEINDVISKINK